MRYPLLLNLLIAAGLAACGPTDSPRAEEASPQAAATEGQGRGFDESKAGTQAPDIPLETGPDGKTETIADILAANPGKPLLVNLWATWCAPCVKELPTLDRLAASTGGKLLVVPISQDMEGWQKVSPAFTADKYPNLQSRLDSAMRYGLQSGATGLPLTILYGPDGRERWRYAGDLDWSSDEARAKIGV